MTVETTSPVALVRGTQSSTYPLDELLLWPFGHPRSHLPICKGGACLRGCQEREYVRYLLRRCVTPSTKPAETRGALLRGSRTSSSRSIRCSGVAPSAKPCIRKVAFQGPGMSHSIECYVLQWWDTICQLLRHSLTRCSSQEQTSRSLVCWVCSVER